MPPPRIEALVFEQCKNLTIFACQFETREFSPQWFSEYQVQGLEHVRDAVLKRQAEFFAGRLCAKYALVYWGIVGVVGRHMNRAPIWPAGMIGSISHSGNYAMAIAIPKVQADLVGIDCEKRIDDTRARELAKTVLTHSEYGLSARSGLSFSDFFVLSFSAKECLYKALHPKVARFFGFSAAELIGLCPESGVFHIRLTEDLAADWSKGRHFVGYFKFTESHVVSLLVE